MKSHRQLIIRAFVNNPPKDVDLINNWATEVIHSVGMNVLDGPYTCYSDIPGNEGHTCVAVLDFSHLAIHVWPEISPALIEFDLFSCKDFDLQVVVDKFERFAPEKIDYYFFDRNDKIHLVDHGTKGK